MKKRSLIEKKLTVWDKWERRTGMPFSEELRGRLEQDLDFNDGETGLEDLDGIIEDFVANVEKSGWLNSAPPARPPRYSRERRYARPLDRRVHLVDFILEGLLTSRNYHERSLKLGKRLATGKKRRIDWKLAASSWNEAHPYDQMTLPVLKATFYRAIADEDVRAAFFRREEIAEAQRALPLIAEQINATLPHVGQALRAMQAIIPAVQAVQEVKEAIRSLPPEVRQQLLREGSKL